MKYLILYTILMIGFLLSCRNNHIEAASALSKSDIEYMRYLKLLVNDEKIYKFYSEYKKKVAGNFFSDKRVATYWIDEKNKEKNVVSFAFYPDIESIDTIYNAGATYSPYMLIIKKDGIQFKVSVNGKKDEIQSFFEDVMREWQIHK